MKLLIFALSVFPLSFSAHAYEEWTCTSSLSLEKVKLSLKRDTQNDMFNATFSRQLQPLSTGEENEAQTVEIANHLKCRFGETDARVVSCWKEIGSNDVETINSYFQVNHTRETWLDSQSGKENIEENYAVTANSPQIQALPASNPFVSVTGVFLAKFPPSACVIR